jgi:hypothetical protein
MTSKFTAPVTLAASVFVAGAVSLVFGFAAPAEAREIDTRITSVSQLSDVSSSHWAYEAITSLVEKYDVLEGYPDAKYRGAKFTTRYELAAALNDLLRAVGEDMANGLALKADKADLDTLAKLQEEFAAELAALRSRTDALETRADAIEAKNVEQDNRLTLLEKTQVHGDFSVGAFGLMADDGAYSSGAGQENTVQGIARLRLTLDVPVVEAEEGKLLGEGKLHTRLIAATGTSNGSGNTPGFSGLSRIASDTSAFNEGSSTSALNTNNRLNVYVERLYYTQDIQPGVPVLTDLFLGDGSPEWDAKGQVFVGIVPFRDFFDKSAYRGNELTQFQNTSLINIPGLPTNANMAMVGYKMNQGLGEHADFQLTAAFGSPNTSDVLNSYNVMYEGRLNYSLPVGDDLAGSFFVGGFHNLNDGSTSSLSNNLNGTRQRGFNTLTGINDTTNHGVYAGLDQEIYKGIGVNLGYFYNAGNANALALNSFNSNTGVGQFNTIGGASTLASARLAATPRQALNAVLNVPMEAIIPGFRDGDHFGIGYAVLDMEDGQSSAALEAQDRLEQVAEAYYTYYLNDSVSFVPSVQASNNRLGLNGNNVAVGVGFRTNIKF